MRTWSLVAQLLGAGALLLALAATPFGAAAGASRPAATSKVVGRVGSLEILNPFLPDPASPSVAAIYLTVKDTGSKADALVAATSPAAPDVMLMTENAHGSFGSMGMLRELRIPAHGQASLAPGHDHVMLEQPTVTFKIGQTVLVTLRFKWAGSVTVEVPVVPLSWILRR
ncbi:MAG: copper chaperone PCu(A)C [Acidimicrobiales bacterium]